MKALGSLDSQLGLHTGVWCSNQAILQVAICAGELSKLGPKPITLMEEDDMFKDAISRSAGLGRTRLFHPWAREPEGGVVRRLRSVSHVVRPRRGSGFEGLGWVPLGPGHVRAPYGSVWVRMSIVHRYGTIESSIGAHRVPSGHIGFRRVSVGNLFWHNGTRGGSTDR